MKMPPRPPHAGPGRLREIDRRYAASPWDEQLHLLGTEGRGLTICGAPGYPVDYVLADRDDGHDSVCRICLPPAPHPLRAVWDLCDRLDQATAAAVRPRPIEPPGRNAPR